MDSDDLVRRISAEVIKRLGSTAAEGARATSGGSPAQTGWTPPTTPKGKSVLVLLTGGNRKITEALEQVGKICDCCQDCKVVLSSSAQKVVGVPAVRRAAPEAEVLTDGDVWKLLDGVGVIYLPNMSLNAASKLLTLLPDSLVCILAIYGLMRGITVVAARDSLFAAEIEPAAAPVAVREKIAGIEKQLAALGVKMCDVEKMTGPGTIIDPQSGESKPNPACTLATNGECSACGLCIENNPDAVSKLVEGGAARVGSSIGAQPVSGDIGRMIDHTLLKPDATEDQFHKLCAEAKQFNFASVCVNPGWVALCARLLAGSNVKVCTVIGFPLGATTPTSKAMETRDAIANGATEIDMVINVGALKSGDDELVRRDIEGVVNAARGQALVKVILETALLTKEEIVKACLLAKMAGANFVKTSTGFGGGGATVEDIALMRETVGPEMGVKASGGIKDRRTAEAMVAAGATRIGASASVAIATGVPNDQKGY
jgi:deoxyribose-phosphate aldolase